jgi:hypothetical protein
MAGFFKNLIMKQAIKSQIKNLPTDQQEKILSALEKDPEFFENISKEIDRRVKQGKGKTQASMEVMRENQGKLRKLMQ